MPRVRILDASMAGYSDYIGGVLFKDGVSVDDVSQVDAHHMAACFLIETLDGLDPSEYALYTAISNGEPPVVMFEDKTEDPASLPVVYDYTRESLQIIADEGGITALRLEGNKYGVKSNSIIGLIDGLCELSGELNSQGE